MASWGLDYDRELNINWGVGLHSDAVIQNFSYEDGDVIKERNSPVALALVAKRNFGEHFAVLGGGGLEVSKGEETLGLIRIGADYDGKSLAIGSLHSARRWILRSEPMMLLW